MRPAFASTKAAAAFAILLLVLLLLPVLLTKSLLPPRQELYAIKGWDTTGEHPYHYHLLFEEKGDIDIAFIGSSHITHAIDTRYVQQKLSKKLGRPATVRTLGWGGPGTDALYFRTKDLLQNRRVKMIVFYDECEVLNRINLLAPVFFRFGDDGDTLAGLPLNRQLNYFYAAILGIPKNILGLVRSPLPPDVGPAGLQAIEGTDAGDGPMESLGSISARHGFNCTLGYWGCTPFIPYSPPNDLQASDISVNSGSPTADFQFNGPPLPSWQLHYAKKFAALAQEHGVKLVLLHIPVLEEETASFINERENWPKELQTPITMIGVQPTSFFKGMSDEDIHKIYADKLHLNKNGQAYFTHGITPTLLEIYAAQVPH